MVSWEVGISCNPTYGGLALGHRGRDVVYSEVRKLDISTPIQGFFFLIVRASRKLDLEQGLCSPLVYFFSEVFLDSRRINVVPYCHCHQRTEQK